MLIGVAVLIAVILVFAAFRPDTFSVERSATIKAAPEKIFPLINDFHQWDAWTPYNKDREMKKTYSGAASGVGASSAWMGNREVGEGSITITESVPPTRIAMDLQMLKPFNCRNRVEFTLIPIGDATTVRWAMSGKSNFVSKLMGLFFNMDKMVGQDFETGLAGLKRLAEK
ncbi:MAG: SRPBCC family protein [Geobacteraceae bacterium]|nr:SRPBCC family protein [Geobacteraceae bacterium]